MTKTKLFTVFMNFHDGVLGVGQYSTVTAEEAVREFILNSEALEHYDRELLVKSLGSLMHVAKEKGIWLFTFDPDIFSQEWPDDNPVLGGHVVQTDDEAPTRPNKKTFKDFLNKNYYPR